MKLYAALVLTSTAGVLARSNNRAPPVRFEAVRGGFHGGFHGGLLNRLGNMNMRGFKKELGKIKNKGAQQKAQVQKQMKAAGFNFDWAKIGKIADNILNEKIAQGLELVKSKQQDAKFVKQDAKRRVEYRADNMSRTIKNVVDQAKNQKDTYGKLTVKDARNMMTSAIKNLDSTLLRNIMPNERELIKSLLSSVQGGILQNTEDFKDTSGEQLLETAKSGIMNSDQLKSMKNNVESKRRNGAKLLQTYRQKLNYQCKRKLGAKECKKMINKVMANVKSFKKQVGAEDMSSWATEQLQKLNPMA